jgi:hypothetical protein
MCYSSTLKGFFSSPLAWTVAGLGSSTCDVNQWWGTLVMLGNKVLVQWVTTTPMDQHLALQGSRCFRGGTLAIPALSIVHKHPLHLLFLWRWKWVAPRYCHENVGWDGSGLPQDLAMRMWDEMEVGCPKVMPWECGMRWKWVTPRCCHEFGMSWKMGCTKMLPWIWDESG